VLGFVAGGKTKEEMPASSMDAGNATASNALRRWVDGETSSRSIKRTRTSGRGDNAEEGQCVATGA
jgi:hypothetical protein